MKRNRRKYKGRVTDGYPRDMWPLVKAMATPVNKQTPDQKALIAKASTTRGVI